MSRRNLVFVLLTGELSRTLGKFVFPRREFMDSAISFRPTLDRMIRVGPWIFHGFMNGCGLIRDRQNHMVDPDYPLFQFPSLDTP